ncbi:hypothetical protein M6B38_101075 [Iris pallida]|uniref:Uncharacterized protein n=1 Tax=Iris pallida TaxID=29817 RepID=A0AAX6IQ07_IRIPA|nr:hypothetical protein M6B38_101075 [Iris pallida]
MRKTCTPPTPVTSRRPSPVTLHPLRRPQPPATLKNMEHSVLRMAASIRGHLWELTFFCFIFLPVRAAGYCHFAHNLR